MNKTIKTLFISCGIATLIGSSAVAMRPIPQEELDQLSTLMKENVVDDYKFNTYGLRHYLGTRQAQLNDPETQAPTLAKFKNDLVYMFNFQIYRNVDIFHALMDRTKEYLDVKAEFYTPEAIAAVKAVIDTLLTLGTAIENLMLLPTITPTETQ